MPDIRGKSRPTAKLPVQIKTPAKNLPRKTTPPPIMPQSSSAVLETIVSPASVTQESPSILMPAMNMAPPETITSISQPIPIISEEPRKSQEDIEAENFLGSLLGQGIAMLGAGIAGRDPGKVGEQFADMRMFSERLAESKKDKELLRQEKAEEKQYVSAIRTQQEETRKRLLKESEDAINPGSATSEAYKSVLRKLGFEPDDSMSYTDLKDPVVIRALQEKKAAKEMKLLPRVGGGVRQPKEPKPEKERKLSQDERQLLNNSALAYKALFDMEDAIKRGVSKTSFLGDNDYTYAANRFVEGIGRMQSGGAIGTEEAENFKKLIPGRFDKEETAKNKIKDMKAELEARLRSINFDPKEVLKSRTYTEEDISPDEQDQAIKWANENINSKDENIRMKAERILRGQ